MGARWHGLAIALLCAVPAAGCGRAEAQDRATGWEHAVFEWARLRDAKEEQERFSFATAADEVIRDNAPAFFSALGLTADSERTATDRMRVLDHLSALGWLLVNRTDVAHADAGGSAIAERYMLRRRR